MATRMRRYSMEELDRRGVELYEQKIGPLVQQGNRGRILAIDIESGDCHVVDEVL